MTIHNYMKFPNRYSNRPVQAGEQRSRFQDTYYVLEDIPSFKGTTALRLLALSPPALKHVVLYLQDSKRLTEYSVPPVSVRRRQKGGEQEDDRRRCRTEPQEWGPAEQKREHCMWTRETRLPNTLQIRTLPEEG